MCTASEEKFSGRMADVWSAGATLYTFVFGRPPFIADTVVATYDMIATAPLELPREPSAELGDLLRRLLEKDPDKRIKVAEAKQHPWVTKGGSWPMPTLEGAQQDVAEETVTEGDIKNAWVMVVRLKARMHRRAEQARASLIGSRAANADGGESRRGSASSLSVPGSEYGDGTESQPGSPLPPLPPGMSLDLRSPGMTPRPAMPRRSRSGELSGRRASSGDLSGK